MNGNIIKLIKTRYKKNIKKVARIRYKTVGPDQGIYQNTVRESIDLS